MFSCFCLEIIGCCFGHSELSLRLHPSGQIPQTKTTTSDFETKPWKRMLRSHYSLNSACRHGEKFGHFALNLKFSCPELSLLNNVWICARSDVLRRASRYNKSAPSVTLNQIRGFGTSMLCCAHAHSILNR